MKDKGLDIRYLNDKADFIGYHIFITLFDGDIEAWENYLNTKGSSEQIKNDYPFVIWLKKQLEKDNDLINLVRDLVKNTKHLLPDRYKDKIDNKISDKINKEMTEGMKKSLKGAKISYLMNAINNWVKSNPEDVSFIGSFATHSVEGDVTDDRMIAYGPKEVLEIHLGDLKKELEKEKDFVNW